MCPFGHILDLYNPCVSLLTFRTLLVVSLKNKYPDDLVPRLRMPVLYNGHFGKLLNGFLRKPLPRQLRKFEAIQSILYSTNNIYLAVVWFNVINDIGFMEHP